MSGGAGGTRGREEIGPASAETGVGTARRDPEARRFAVAWSATRMDKAHIIEAIKQTAADNGGAPLGLNRFSATTGISKHAWLGKFWRNWGEALAEAGFAPNRLSEPVEPDALLRSLAGLVRKLGRFPSYADLKLERRSDASVPSVGVFYKLGSIAARVEALRTYATAHPEYADVLDALPAPGDVAEEGAPQPEDQSNGNGSVYMLKLAKHYKIGKTFNVPRRHQEIAIELPEKPDVVHVITTDDPTGIEAYWHKRFASKHTNGEWFALTPADVRAFKRRKFM